MSIVFLFLLKYPTIRCAYDLGHFLFHWVQICITTSTAAGVEQILPWMFYHKVIGVTNFFLFVEGKAASSTVSKVLESIPVRTLFLPCPVFLSFYFTIYIIVTPHANVSGLLFLNLVTSVLFCFFSGSKSYIQNKRARRATG